MGVFRTHPEEDVKSFISNRRNESRFPERAEHCYTSGGNSRRARAAALIGFMSGDVYWGPSIECTDLRGRGKRYENAVKKSPKKLGEEEGDLGRDGGGIKISSAPSLPLSFPLESHPRFEDDGPFFTLVKSLEPDRERGEEEKRGVLGRTRVECSHIRKKDSELLLDAARHRLFVTPRPPRFADADALNKKEVQRGSAPSLPSRTRETDLSGPGGGSGGGGRPLRFNGQRRVRV